MENYLELEGSRLKLLAEARSALWALKELTSSRSDGDCVARSYLYELHQIAERGIASVDHVIDDMEVFGENARAQRLATKRL